MTEQETQATRIGAGDYVAPVLYRRAFHCPHCGVYAPQTWKRLVYELGASGSARSHVCRGECSNCDELTYWLAEITFGSTDEDGTALMVFPEGSSNAPQAHLDMPADVKADYDEARAIVDRSPRGAAALLRLALQKLMVDLCEGGKNLNDDIKALVAKGLPVGVQQALDALRVIGNNAVHPGEIDLTADRDTAVALFGVLNYIVEQQITQPNKLAALYNGLPPTAVAAIANRDGAADQQAQT